MAAAVATTTILSKPDTTHKRPEPPRDTKDALRTPTRSPVADTKPEAPVAKPEPKPEPATKQAETPEPESPEVRRRQQ